MNDRELVRSCLAGDPAAWQRLDREYRPLLASAASEGLRRAGAIFQPADVDEIVQTVLESLCLDSGRRLASFRGLCRLSTWLSVLAIRAALNYARGRRRAEARQLRAVTRERFVGSRAELDEALQGLPPIQRAALRLYFFEGMSRQEIAELLGMSPNSISSLLVRALRAARQQA
jgi:RNA polymerase sigma-70 factor (ECF subfamily)